MIPGAPLSPFRLGGFLGATLLLAFFPACPCPAEDAPATNSTAPTPPTPAETAQDLIGKSTRNLADGNLDDAVSEANMAIQLDPQNPSAYELRGSIYIEKKIWDQAERDYAKADQISPDPAYKYKLGEIKYVQRSFGDARFHFAQLQKDPRLGDLANYKVFLCDLLDGHESIAAQDLAAIDRGPKNPSFYFCHCVWASYHGSPQEANKYLVTARKLYDRSTYELYYLSLVELHRFRPAVATFTTKDGKKFEKTAVFLEGNELRVSTQKGWITLTLDQLPDDLSGFPEEQRDLIIKQRASLPSPEAPVSLLSFTAKSGKIYDHARWALQETGLSVLTPDGWVSVPLDQLPTDLSSFPKKLQQAILEKRKAAASASTIEDVISFTTTRGKQYDQVRASLTGAGLRVLSVDGWVEISFEQLPADLTPFPAEWRAKIRAAHPSGSESSTGTKLVSFTTKKGTHYDEVQAAMEKTGLRLLTSDGLIAVPFDQLPDDVSVFPEEWREQIISKQKSISQPANQSSR